jgi:hypothetical protein
MNVLDENVVETQCRLFRKWRVRFQQIGFGIGSEGMKDSEIISLLHDLASPTFITRDADFFERNLCHAGYCLVYAAVEKNEVAVFTRRLLRHPKFNTKAKRAVNGHHDLLGVGSSPLKPDCPFSVSSLRGVGPTGRRPETEKPKI